ncbi:MULTISPECIES: isoprenylcysteine carboxylmethyltransferase family protein [Burkholderia]|uniref:methyltransferase family protein n=1 Tax=Burkholderia TaxID=32008 RepID=UPI000328039E|nr:MULTISPECIES: isoprenylcysteine carboxylmethyltransferase family protein [Burkholderia]AGK50605.1 isoprenylcysteine carboxyl methyltransferase family protein [Burkholderia thailandensis MSMB121]ATF33764.1 isoprenylcysteine carboxylmethyltransferase family protein [Burkholderia thailandensis]KST71844.1 isoprenylcysteine carboxyl methyltransferase [Burkholderia humptydooensis]KVN03301.1 isoprenylcysteine carboxyl methyltransferase [Burkholderia sp. MSMB1552]KWZ49962.1 isoprenylcysteine carbox
MDSLSKRVLGAQARFVAALAVLIFASAGSLRYWQGWIYWLVFSGATTWLALHFLKHDPALVESRMRVGVRAERELSQKIIVGVVSVASVGLVVAMGAEWRVAHTPVDWRSVALGNALVIAGFAICFAVLRANRFASSIVEVTRDQTVISSGPYRLVRHPMYSGAMVIFFGSPIAAQSTWAWPFAAVLAAGVVARLVDEERYLSAHLDGYRAYCERVRWRLVPRVW